MSAFLYPLGLWAMIAVPTVVGLHLFRRRFQPHTVSALFLWFGQEHTSMAGRQLERLHRSPSFWAEVLAALLLALAFASPRLPWTRDAEHLVVVLDASASMGATAPDGDLRESALTAVRKRIDDLPIRSRVTVLESGSTPRVLAGPAAMVSEAVSALDDYEPRSMRHDLTPSVALAAQLSGEGAVLLVTDRFQPDAFPAEVELLAVGQATDNLAITHAARWREGEEHKVFLTVANFAPRTVQSELTLTVGSQELNRRALTLEADERRHLSFEVPARTPTLVAQLTDDALAIDNQATLAPPPSRVVRLACTLPVETARFLGLMNPGADSRLDRLGQILDDVEEVLDPAQAHLVVGPPTGIASDAWTFQLDTPGEARRDLIGPFLSEKRHPLMQGLTLEGIVWSIDPDLTLVGAPLVSAGNLPILTETREGERRHYQVNLDPKRSSIQRSPDWPILLTNLVELRREALPGAERGNIVAGEEFVYRDDRDRTYLLRSEHGEREIQARGTLVLDDLTEPGRYELLADGRVLCEFGVTFADAAESNLTALGDGKRPSSVELEKIASSFGVAEIALILLALGLLLFDVFVLSGRRIGGGRPQNEEALLQTQIQ